MLTIQSLHAQIDGKPILKGVDLSVQPGEVHAVMGPNGAGKSTLAKVIAGHPAYEVVEGKVEFNGENLLDLEPHERSHKGVFMSFQYPVEIPGVSNIQFLHSAYNAHRKSRGEDEIGLADFETFVDEKMKQMQIDGEFKERCLNEGFSGGEKKRNEILQMAVLDPSLAILDETDSGLDIDAMRIVASGINKMRTPKRAMILITHYQRLLEYLQPDVVHVMLGGKIVRSGGAELALKLEEKGYDTIDEARRGAG